MRSTRRSTTSWSGGARRLGRALVLAAVLACGGLTGCAALTNPVAEGLPVDQVPHELLGESREAKKPIPLGVLGQEPPAEYRVDAGDVLGVWVEGVLGSAMGPVQPQIFQPAPTQPPTLLPLRDQQPLPGGTGYPIRIDDNGTVTLPQLAPLPVRGLTLTEVRELIRAAYVKAGVLKKGEERIIVSLLYQRRYSVVVIRQESNNLTTTPQGLQTTGKRGTGHEVFLPAYENDVLHALAHTGGFPGIDACDEVIVHRACRPTWPPADHPPAVRIPLRWRPDLPLPFGPQDIILQPGDTLFVNARDNDVYFTGGLLPPGEYVLPRDVDLDVVEAVARVQGPLVNGAFAVSNLTGTVIQPGIGNPSPTLLSVLRKTPGGGQVTIRVELDKALRDPSERILVQPGDMLILQETPGQALARFLSQTANVSLNWQFIRSRFFKGIFDFSAPQFNPNRVTVTPLGQ